MRKLRLVRGPSTELGDADLACVAAGAVLTSPCTDYPTRYGGVTGCLQPLLTKAPYVHSVQDVCTVG